MDEIIMKPHLRVHYFQHIMGEGFGSCEAYFKQNKAQITATEFFALPPEQKLEIEALPKIEDIDLLIIMGGTMSVNDENIYPWLITEKRWLRRFIALGKPVIGLCLGGQMIANALGAKVTHNAVREVGWIDVQAVVPYPENCFKLPQSFNIMQWHGETFALPKGAKLLAYNAACAHQAFQINHNILGFQFHPEITPHAMDIFLEDDQELGLFSAQPQQLKSELTQYLKPANAGYYLEGNQLLNQAIEYVLNNTDEKDQGEELALIPAIG